MRRFLVSTAIAVGAFGFYKAAEVFSPGRYPYAENYELPYPEEKVKEAIIKFKQKNPEYLVPKVTIQNQGSWDLADEPIKDPSYWYKFYFYYKNENQILFTWTSSLSKDKTTLAFVSINNGLDIGNWKNINKDFSVADNKKQKKIFEERILNKIKDELNEK